MGKTLFVSVLSVFMAVGFACGSKNGGSGFNDGDSSDGGQLGEGGKGFGTGGGDGGSGGCTGLQCKEVDCPGGGDTTITGQVFDPIGLNPLYGVAVYVPSQLPLATLASGATCDRCGATVLNPASTTLTDEDGKFTLTHVPVDANVPVVVQIGKWRRTFNLDVTACQENPMPMQLTLPKNGTEGDIPQVAVAYGSSDSLECLLYGMGLDANEFVQGATAAGTGHVHLYGSGKQNQLWQSKDTLMPYDITMLDCESDEVTSNKNDAMIQGLHDYTSEGGKVFASHYESIFFKGQSGGGLKAPSDFVSTANWNSSFAEAASSSGTTGTINTGFPKGASFAQWMKNVGASTTLGTINDMGYADSVNSVAGDTTLWISDADHSNHVLYMSFNTPTTETADNQCGKVVYTDLHVSGGAVSSISQCKFKNSSTDRSKGMSDQQKALEFLFFDLSSCVSNDANPPQPPR